MAEIKLTSNNIKFIHLTCNSISVYNNVYAFSSKDGYWAMICIVVIVVLVLYMVYWTKMCQNSRSDMQYIDYMDHMYLTSVQGKCVKHQVRHAVYRLHGPHVPHQCPG